MWALLSIKYLIMAMGALTIIGAVNRRVFKARHRLARLDPILTKLLVAVGIGTPIVIVIMVMDFLALAFKWPAWIETIFNAIAMPAFAVLCLLALWMSFRLLKEGRTNDELNERDPQ